MFQGNSYLIYLLLNLKPHLEQDVYTLIVLILTENLNLTTVQ